MSKISLRPITELLEESFFIPAYQRGYRWTEPQVLALLNDLWKFRQANGAPNEFYCLQPIVVKQREGGSWELVDGQQRLTTIYLILTCLDLQMQMFEKTKFLLEFETRSETSGAFLNKIDTSLREDNIDFFHISEAYDVITEWFEGKSGPEKAEFLRCFVEAENRNARVIWYELPEGEAPVKAFTRLNVGKIRLTNAELIRALFLRSGNFEAGNVNLQQLKIAQEWDAIEKALQSDGMWYFLSTGEKNYSSRIEFVFERIAEADGASLAGEYPTFYFFNDKLNHEEFSVEGEWLRIKQCFMTLDEWYSNRVLHHLIGFLIEDGDSIGSLLAAGQAMSKSDFQVELKARIYQRLIGQLIPAEIAPDELKEAVATHVSGLDYEDDGRSIRSLLLLFNITTLLQNPNSNPLFPFDHFKKEKWDIEHVHSVSSEMPTEKKHCLEWLGDFTKHMGGTGEGDELCAEATTIGQADPFNVEQFGEFYRKVLNEYQESGDVDNGIGNLALLNSGTNRSYKNAVFPVKRNKIIGSERDGLFVPLCTKNVFLKCYSKKIGDMFYWSKEDRACYRNGIVNNFTKFFTTAIEE